MKADILATKQNRTIDVIAAAAAAAAAGQRDDTPS